MNTLRQRMTDEMNLAGLAASTQQTYLGAVDKLAAYTWRSLEEMPEKDIQEYLLSLRDRGAARGSFKTALFGIRFLYHHVLGRNWALFTKKRSGNPVRSACPVSSPMDRSCPF
ncbi:MAG: phage integrase N-terminal SAM-like domain-containing protein [Magnetococcales bacterium]|nr:phage integrase N-terminal SAM-like domain-containing protein [Magnetococcales bacterium]